MADDRKHLYEIKVRLTEHEYLSVSRAAAYDSRPTAEWVRTQLRRVMFGIVPPAERFAESNFGPDEGLR